MRRLSTLALPSRIVAVNTSSRAGLFADGDRKDRPAFKGRDRLDLDVGADGLKQRMTGGDPLARRVSFQKFLVEITSSYSLPRRPNRGSCSSPRVSRWRGMRPNTIDVGTVAVVGQPEAHVLRCLDEEIFDHLGNETTFLSLGGLADDGGEIEFRAWRGLQESSW